MILILFLTFFFPGTNLFCLCFAFFMFRESFEEVFFCMLLPPASP